MRSSLGKNIGTVSASNHGSFAARAPGSSSGVYPKNTSGLGPLGRNDLIRVVQAIVLQFPIKEAAEHQDATTKAVESQRNGDSAMSLLAAANMCRSNVRARALFAPLFGFTGCYTDPDFMEGMEKLALGYLRQQQTEFTSPPASPSPRDASVTGEDDDLTGDLFAAMGNA